MANMESLNDTNKISLKMLRTFVNQNTIVKGWPTYVAYILPSKYDSSSTIRPKT